MPTLYKINTFSGDNQISDIVSKATSTDSTGSLVVPVKDSLDVGSPTTLTELLDAKYAALLAHYPGYNNIAYHTCLNVSGVDTTNSDRVILGSGAQHHQIIPGGTLRFSPVGLVGTTSSCLLLWETYLVNHFDDSINPIQRTWLEDLPSAVACKINFQGAAPSITAISGSPIVLSGAEEGASFTVSFQRLATPQRSFLAGWALLYTATA